MKIAKFYLIVLLHIVVMFKGLSGDAPISEMQCLRGRWVLGKERTCRN